MEYRINRRTGDKISVLGLGTSYIAEAGEKDAVATIQRAYAGGINYYDLATAEGRTFPYFGTALGAVRKNVFYQIHFGANYASGTYGWSTDGETIRRSIEWQLTQLKTDYIDYGFIHCIDELFDWQEYQKNGAFSYLMQMKEQGVIRHIGLSSHTPATIHRVLDEASVDMLMFSVNPGYDYQKGDYAKGSVDERAAIYSRCETEGIGISVMKPFSGGQLLDAAISPFGKALTQYQCMQVKRIGILGIAAASILGIASPLCMYGTIPLAASFSKSGIKDDWLAAFMMSSILLNPQLIIYSTALGVTVLAIRIVSCFLCGVIVGVLVRYFSKGKSFFDFKGFEEPKSRDIDPNVFVRLLKNIGRNIKATGLYFLLGIVLSVLFQRYIPAEVVSGMFGKNEGFGVLMAATIGVPLYACGGGTIPLLMTWLADGMSIGSAAAFMITGPATKITNLGAVKIVLGVKRFLLYLAYVMVFSLMAGLLVNVL